MDMDKVATGVGKTVVESMNNVDTNSIDLGIEYIRENFTEPLVKTGEDIRNIYHVVASVLQSETITRSIRSQRYRIDHLRSDLESIFNKAREGIEKSNTEIKKDQAIIDDDLAE